MEDELFESNLAAMATRWPNLARKVKAHDLADLHVEVRQGISATLCVNELQLSSRHDPESEAVVQAKSLAPGPVLTLYGLGLGFLALELLKSRPSLQQLRIVIMNTGLLRVVISDIDLTDIFNDPRTILCSAIDEAVPQSPYFVSPPDFYLADEYAYELRKKLLHEKTAKFNNDIFIRMQDETYNRISRNIELIESDGDVADFFDSAIGRTAFIIGAGPTLNQTLTWCQLQLRTKNPPLIIAVDTALRPLAQIGIRPDIVVSIDRNKREKFLYTGMGEVPLVYSPALANDVIKAWPGPRYTTYFELSEYDKWRKSHPKASLLSLGSVIHSAVDLAIKMGVNQIVLLGADFGFPDGENYARTLEKFSSKKLKISDWVIDGYGKKIPTMPNLNGYLMALEEYIGLHPEVRFYNSSRSGACIKGTHYISTD